MHDEDANFVTPAGDAALPAVGALRFITLHAAADTVRRRAARRRSTKHVAFERRHGDRRLAKPGIDGLLRTILADDWE